MGIPSIKNRVGMTVTGTPGTGTITLNAAESGYQSFATAYGANANVDILIEDGTAWEIARDCTYTHSGTTVTRGTLEASSTGSAISLTSAAKVYVVDTATRMNRATLGQQAILPGGRLTLESGVPVSTTDQTAKTTIYYTPFVHNLIVLWDGAQWVPTEFAETSHALGTVTSGANYDVFAYLNSGALGIEKLIWTNDSTRATAVTLQDGRYCKSGDKTRLYLGTFRSTSTTATEDSEGGASTQTGGKRFVWNAYNQFQRQLRVIDTADNWTYGTNTIRRANAATGEANQVFFVAGLPAFVTARIIANWTGASNGSVAAKSGIGVDSVSAFSGITAASYNFGSAGLYSACHAEYRSTVSAGYHYLSWLENGADGSTSIFIGDNGADGQQSGLYATVNA